MIVSTPNGTTSNAMVAADLAHVLWAVNMGCLGFHLWPYRRRDPGHADELRIDLDPQPGVSFDDGPRGGGRGPFAAGRTGNHRVREDQRQPRAPHLRAGSSPGGTRTRSGPPRWRWPASWSDAGAI